MTITLKVSAGGPPPGAYVARFCGIETTTHNEYGAGLKWTWEVVNGVQAGQKATRVSSPHPTLKNACGKMIAGLLGRALAIGEDTGAEIEKLIGNNYMILVESTESGATRVGSVLPAPTA